MTTDRRSNSIVKLEMKVDVRPCEKKQESRKKQIKIAPQRVTGGSRKFAIWDVIS